jgi:predicted HTH domain antitoxin
MIAPNLELGEDVLALIRQPDRSDSESARELIVLELYRRGTISSGRAAELIGMGKREFIQYSGRLGIPFFNYSPDELAAELAAAREIADGRP